MNKVLVVNAGSSTIKWKLFNVADLSTMAEGVADRIFVDGVIETKFNGEKHERTVSLKSHKDASLEIVKDLKDLNIIDDLESVSHIGFRVVMGGTEFTKTTVIDEEVISKIDAYSVLAPLHNPGAVQAMKAFREIFPSAKSTGTFDTSFHTTIPSINSSYPMNKKLATELQIKKYGFHGTSHHYITNKLEEILSKDKVNFVNLHIGNGASLCAIKDSKSIDTSMGLTPLAGIMMGTRSGDIDPSIIGYIMKQKNMTIEEVDTMLLKDSGLKGVSGISQDMRDIKNEAANGNNDAIFAIDLYSQKIIDYTVNYLNKVGKADAIVFTAGVGENAAIVREKVISGINIINVKLDLEANKKIEGDVKLISTNDSDVPIYVIRTDEELMIAKDALAS